MIPCHSEPGGSPVRARPFGKLGASSERSRRESTFNPPPHAPKIQKPPPGPKSRGGHYRHTSHHYLNPPTRIPSRSTKLGRTVTQKDTRALNVPMWVGHSYPTPLTL